MENLLILDDKAKTRIGIICLLPTLAFLGCFAYFMVAIGPVLGAEHQPGSQMASVLVNYNTMFVLLAIASIIAAIVLIYALTIIAKIRHINSATKTMWILFMATFAPVSAVFFWYFLIRKEAKYVPVYPNIA